MTSYLVEKNHLFLPLTNIALVMSIVTWELVKKKSQAPHQTNWIGISSLIRCPDVLCAHEIWEAMENGHCFEL